MSCWIKRQDESSGDSYWFNPQSQQSCWERPAECEELGEWIEQAGDDGEMFYTNSITEESRWEVPGTAAGAPTTISPSKRRKTLVALGKRLKQLAQAEAKSKTGDTGAAPAQESKLTPTSETQSAATAACAAGVWRGRAKKRSAHKNLNLNRQLGLPVRELLQSMYKINRDKTVIELLIFSCFMAVFMTIVVSIHQVHLAATTNAGLMDLFLDEEFPGAQYKKTFADIATMEEFWNWVEGPLLGGAYPEEWYNGDPLSENEEQYVLMYNRLVGGIQLRQLRVTNESCSERRFESEIDSNGLPRFDTLSGSCFAEFSASDEMTEPYGPSNVWTHQSDLSPLDGLVGFGPSYGTGGYVVELPTNRQAALANVTFLKENLWTDQATRAIAIDFNLYNTQTKMVTTARILVEFFMSGHVVPSSKFFTYKFVVYQSRLDMFRVALEVVFAAFLVYFIQKEARVMYYFKPMWSYFLEFKNIFEVIMISLCAALMVYWMMFVTSKERSEFTVNSPHYMNMFDFATRYVNVISLAGTIGLLCCLKVFKFMSISKKMNALWLTLGRAAPDLVAFAIGFIFLVFGFAFMAEMMFGFAIMDFHNITSSFSTLLRFPLGDFDYDDLVRARPELAGIFFSLYVAMVFLVCMNMIIGIVTLYFEEVHAELQMSDKWKLATRSFEADLIAKTSFCCRRRCRAFGKCGRREASSASERRQSVRALYSEENQRLSDENQVKGWELEKQFLQRMRMLMRYSRRRQNIDLFRYVDKIYQQFDDINLYIGVHELCEVSSVEACPPGTHTSCHAAHVIEAYNAMKNVLMVGEVKRHTPQSSRAQVAMTKYRVIKINRNGLKQSRTLCLDEAKCALLNFSDTMRLRKAIPLHQLLQIEKSLTDERRVDLVFSSSGFSAAGKKDTRIEKLDALETSYLLSFPDRDRREKFCAHLLRALCIAQVLQSRGMELDSDDEVPADVLDDAKALSEQAETPSAPNPLWQMARRASGKRPNLANVVAAAQATNLKSAGGATSAQRTADAPPAASPDIAGALKRHTSELQAQRKVLEDVQKQLAVALRAIQAAPTRRPRDWSIGSEVRTDSSFSSEEN